MRSVSLPSIVAYLKSQPTAAAVFGARIYVGEPVSDVQAGIYLVLNTVSQTRDDVGCYARVEFRYMAHSESVTKQALVAAQDEVSALIATGGPLDMAGFKVTHVDEGSDFLGARDDKNRNILIRDYMLRFIWSN